MILDTVFKENSYENGNKSFLDLEKAAPLLIQTLLISFQLEKNVNVSLLMKPFDLWEQVSALKGDLLLRAAQSHWEQLGSAH